MFYEKTPDEQHVTYTTVIGATAPVNTGSGHQFVGNNIMIYMGTYPEGDIEQWPDFK